MKFHLNMTITLKKDFTIEAEHLKDATAIAEKQLMEEVDLNTLEIDSIGLDLTDPTIHEYNRQYCKKMIEQYKAKQNENNSNG